MSPDILVHFIARKARGKWTAMQPDPHLGCWVYWLEVTRPERVAFPVLEPYRSVGLYEASRELGLIAHDGYGNRVQIARVERPQEDEGYELALRVLAGAKRSELVKRALSIKAKKEGKR